MRRFLVDLIQDAGAVIMTRGRSSSPKRKPKRTPTLDVDRLFRTMEEQRARAEEMITRVRAMRMRALEMQDKMSRPTFQSIILPENLIR